MSMSNRILRKAVDRRTVLKAATGAAAGFYAWGIPGKSYQRAFAQDDVLAQILAIPGAGGQPTEADMERVGELCLRSTKQGRVLRSDRYVHRLEQRRLSQQYFSTPLTGLGRVHGGDDPVDRRPASGDLLQDSAGGRHRGDRVRRHGGRGSLGGRYPRSRTGQSDARLGQRAIDLSDYVKLLQAPVGTWEDDDLSHLHRR